MFFQRRAESRARVIARDLRKDGFDVRIVKHDGWVQVGSMGPERDIPVRVAGC